MRLGQLARKCNVQVQDMVSYLEENGVKSENLNHNSKLDQTTEKLLIQYFSNDINEEDEQLTKGVSEHNEIQDSNESVPDDNIAEDEIATPPDTQSDQVSDHSENKIELTIQSDELLELLEEPEVPINLDEIKVIKAPKKELDGLKVVGKIDLPEPKNKSKEDSEEIESEPEKATKPTKRRRLVSDEELEERRLRAKRKKEAYEARLERRRKEAEEKKIKARKEAHYRKKLELKKESKPKIIPIQDPVEIEEPELPKKPTSLLGKIWYWLNHPDD